MKHRGDIFVAARGLFRVSEEVALYLITRLAAYVLLAINFPEPDIAKEISMI